MQEENLSFRTFSRRTDALASELNVTLSDLSKHLGLSRRMLFGYRKGEYPVTHKAWSKLEKAEKRAGIAVRENSHPMLEDMKVEEQPSDESLRAYRAENPRPESFYCMTAAMKAFNATVSRYLDQAKLDELFGEFCDELAVQTEAALERRKQTICYRTTGNSHPPEDTGHQQTA